MHTTTDRLNSKAAAHTYIAANTRRRPLTIWQCDIGYYNTRSDDESDDNGPACAPCFVGLACTSLGMTLHRLPLARGYYRASRNSTNVRRCADFDRNCSLRGGTASCPPEHSTSGCHGGDDVDAPCLPSLTGKFCLLCENRTTSYYVEATRGAAATCMPCADRLRFTTGVVASVVAALLLAVVLVQMVLRCLRRLYTRQLRDQALMARAVVFARTVQIKAKVLPLYSRQSRLHIGRSHLSVHPWYTHSL